MKSIKKSISKFFWQAESLTVSEVVQHAKAMLYDINSALEETEPKTTNTFYLDYDGDYVSLMVRDKEYNRPYGNILVTKSSVEASTLVNNKFLRKNARPEEALSFLKEQIIKHHLPEEQQSKFEKHDKPSVVINALTDWNLT